MGDVNRAHLMECNYGLEQCLHDYRKLNVVPKNITFGPRAGLHYRNQNGKIIYLKKEQKKRLQRNNLSGASTTYRNVPYNRDPQPYYEFIRDLQNQ